MTYLPRSARVAYIHVSKTCLASVLGRCHATDTLPFMRYSRGQVDVGIVYRVRAGSGRVGRFSF